METFKGILVILVLVLAGTSFLFFVESRAAQAKVNSAQTLGAQTLALLKLQHIRCDATSGQFDNIVDCIGPALRAGDFKQDSLRQPNDRTGEPGYLVIQNVNARTYEADLFRFYFNRELIKEGCHVPGEIGKDVVCRFDLPQRCESGDILEVTYPVAGNETRVFLATC